MAQHNSQTDHVRNADDAKVIVGDYVLRIDPQHGGLLRHAPATQQPTIWYRTVPVDLQPPVPLKLIGRQAEIHNAQQALQAKRAVELIGEDGIGKTSLLQVVAGMSRASVFPDGIVYLSMHTRQGKADLLQILYSAFHESNVPFRPNDAQLRRTLRHMRALVVLDDVHLTRDEMTDLMDTAAGCTFLLASSTSRLGSQGHSIQLGRLELDDAIKLVEHTLSRSLTGAGRIAATTICKRLEGHPLRIIQAAGLTHAQNQTLQDIALKLTKARPLETLTTEILATLSESEKHVVRQLAVFGSAPLRLTHIDALVENGDTLDILRKLQERGIVQNYGPYYNLTGALSQSVQLRWNLEAYIARALDYFVEWTQRSTRTPALLLSETATILLILDTAVDHHSWKNVARITAALESTLVLNGHWDAWAHILQAELQAAHALRDRPLEARIMHQQGIRALCLGEIARGRSLLIKAMRLRKMLGDEVGRKITRHILELLVGAPPPRSSSVLPQPGHRPWYQHRFTAIVSSVATVLFLIILMQDGPQQETTPTAVALELQDTESPIVTSLPSDTVTTTPTAAVAIVTVTPNPVVVSATPSPLPPTPSDTPTPTAIFNVTFKEVRIAGPVSIDYDGTMRVPIHGIIVNNDGRNIGPFKIIVESMNSPTRFEVPLNVDENDRTLLFLAPSATKVFDGVMAFPASLQGSAMPVNVKIQMCSDDENCEESDLYKSDTIFANLPHVVYDFVERADKARWTGHPDREPGLLPFALRFNGNDSDAGFARWFHNYTTEDGTIISKVLHTHPTWTSNGRVEGKYDLTRVAIEGGDYIVVNIGFLPSATGGEVEFKIEFHDGNPDLERRPIKTWTVKYDDDTARTMHYDAVTLPNDLAGKQGFFYLVVDAKDEATNDWAVWGLVRLMRP